MAVRSWLKPATLAVMVAAVGSLAAPVPVQAQDVTVLRGSQPQSAPSIDCSNPYYYQYCQAGDAGNGQNYSPYGYDSGYPYYDSGFPHYGYGSLGVGVGHRFFNRRGFHGGGFNRGFRGIGIQGGFRGGVHGGGFHGGGFHGGGFHGGGFHGGGFHGGSFHR